MISNLTKVKPLKLTTLIASSFISTLGICATLDIGNQAKAIMVSGNPSDYIVKPGTGYDGVASLLINRVGGVHDGCTGSLLSTGLHILTAAHCLTRTIENVSPGIIPGKFDNLSTIVNFESPALASNQGVEGINASEFYIHPDWSGDLLAGNDIAIIKLTQQASAKIERYDIYRATDELNQIVTKVGYGASGNGNTGATIQDSLKRSGENIYEISLGKFIDALNQDNPNSYSIPDAVREKALGYDFDNGLEKNDFFGYYGISNTGLGLNEVMSFSGDSGGPGFINNLVAGISSFNGTGDVVPPDVDVKRNGSFGEFSFDTRVSSYANYIDDVLAGKIEPTYKVPEPSTILGSILALALAINFRFKLRDHL